jgi:hypothetical protein
MRLFIAASLIAASAAGQVTISGRVLDVSGRPLASSVSAVELVPPFGKYGPNVQTQSDGSFVFNVAAGEYAVIANLPAPLDPLFARADARNGNVSDLQFRVGSRMPLIPDTPPRASLINVSAPDGNNDAVVTGAAGSVPANSFLLLVTLDTGHYVITRATADGSFRASIFGPYGSSIMVKADSLGLAFQPILDNLNTSSNPIMNISELPGTIVRVPPPPATGAGTVFGVTGLVAAPQEGDRSFPWTFRGTLANARLPAGGSLDVSGTLRVFFPAPIDEASRRVDVDLRLERLSGADGRPATAQNTYASTLLTPTGLPIERQRNDAVRAPGFATTASFPLLQTSADRAEGNLEMTLPLAADAPAGYYVVVVRMRFNFPGDVPSKRKIMPIENLVRRDAALAYLPVVRIGAPQPPRIPATLLTDVLSNGVRGVGAVEDRGGFVFSSRVRTATDLLVVRRTNASAQPVLYNLEPFLPSISLVIGPRPNLPVIPFRFPSGRLSVRIEKPDGSITSIGPEAFVQPRLRGNGLEGTSIHDPFTNVANGGNVVRAGYQLTTLDPRFDVAFDQDGRHLIRVDGTIDDVWGNTWAIGGTYEIHVGRLLSLDTGVMAGTPFEAGDPLSADVTVTPPVPAEIEVRVRLAPASDATRMIDRTVRGRANRFGSFQEATGLVLDQPGEYRMDVTATYTDAAGKLWKGTRTWGGIVAPRNPSIIAHGRRGMVNSNLLGSQWYFRTQTPFHLPSSTHPMPAFHSGDVMWAQKSDTEFALITFEDPSRSAEDLLRKRMPVGLRDPGTFDERVVIGELPLFSNRQDQVDPHIDPARVDLWGYSYRYIERPLIAVRESIAEDGIPLVYWGFHDPYAGQIGMGQAGDLPNDVKFQFGGAVLRGSALSAPLYAAYASLFVLVADDDPGGGTRVFPPFQGNPGGQNGGALFTLGGKPIDLFFHPTAVRPGTILQLGEWASFAGYSAPTLPSKIEIVVTSPSGRTSTIRGQANNIGWFHGNGLEVDEAGVWKAKVRIAFDGRTSAGQVNAPYPSGDVLGSRDGEFYFYVVSPAAPPLQVSPSSQFARAINGPLAFTITPPPGLTDVQTTYTTTMPAFILEERATTAMSVVYDARNLSRQFPNLDVEPDGGDVVTISFLLSGTDSGGIRRYFARRIVLHGEEVLVTEQKETPFVPRRRAVHK